MVKDAVCINGTPVVGNSETNVGEIYTNAKGNVAIEGHSHGSNVTYSLKTISGDGSLTHVKSSGDGETLVTGACVGPHLEANSGTMDTRVENNSDGGIADAPPAEDGVASNTVGGITIGVNNVNNGPPNVTNVHGEDLDLIRYIDITANTNQGIINDAATAGDAYVVNIVTANSNSNIDVLSTIGNSD